MGEAEVLSGDDLVSLVGAYRLSAAVVAMAELGIPDLLADGALTPEDLARECRVPLAPIRRLVRMLASRGALIEDDRGRVMNTGLSDALRRGPQRDMVLGWTALPEIFAAWSSIVPALRVGTFPFRYMYGTGFHEHLATHPASSSAYAAATGSTGDEFDGVAAAMDLSACSCVVSVGGGQGQELVPLLRRWPHLRAVLVDLPAALDGAENLLRGCGLADRVRIEPGDAREGLPAADAYVLLTVLRCLDDDEATAVLAACEQAGAADMQVSVVEMPLAEGFAAHPGATADMTAWVVYGGADRTINQWMTIHDNAGLKVGTVTPLDGPYALLASRRR